MRWPCGSRRGPAGCDASAGPVLGPALAGCCTAFWLLRPALRRAVVTVGAGRQITFSARSRCLWWCRRARPVARRVRFAAPDAALRVLCVVLDAVPLVRFVVPDAAACQTSAHLRAAWWARREWWWLGLPPLTPLELLTKRQLQMLPRIQGKRVRCADRPAWPLNLDPFPCSGFLPRSMSLSLQAELLIWINLARTSEPRWNIHRRYRHSRNVRDDGPRSDNQSVVKFGSRKILSFFLCCERLG